jgi:hypothetical protein
MLIGVARLFAYECCGNAFASDTFAIFVGGVGGVCRLRCV